MHDRTGDGEAGADGYGPYGAGQPRIPYVEVVPGVHVVPEDVVEEHLYSIQHGDLVHSEPEGYEEPRGSDEDERQDPEHALPVGGSVLLLDRRVVPHRYSTPLFLVWKMMRARNTGLPMMLIMTPTGMFDSRNAA